LRWSTGLDAFIIFCVPQDLQGDQLCNSASWHSYLQSQPHASSPPWSGSNVTGHSRQAAFAASDKQKRGWGWGWAPLGWAWGWDEIDLCYQPPGAESGEPPVSWKTNVRGHLFRPHHPATVSILTHTRHLFSALNTTLPTLITARINYQASSRSQAPRAREERPGERWQLQRRHRGWWL
jgi:hypothetical protein